MAETLALRPSRAATLSTGHSLKHESGELLLMSRSKSHLDMGRELSRVSKIDIEFRKAATTVRSAETLDTADAQFKINSFLEQFLCHFTQNLCYNKADIRDHLDVLSMECSIIPSRCRAAYYNLMGYLYASLEKRDKADRYFDLALKLNPDDTVAYVNKAMNYLESNEVIKCYPLIRRLKEIQSRSKHLPGSTPLSVAQNTIALAYNKLGLSCAALHYYHSALKTDSLNCDVYLGKGEVLLRMSQHQGRANTLDRLNEGISDLKKYIAEYNVLNLAKDTDERESPLPRDTKAVNNVFAVVILARALNERSRKLGKEYTTEAFEMIDLALDHSEGNAYTLYQLGDELRLMGRLDGQKGALSLLRQAVDLRESPVIYHSYALSVLSFENLRYQERFRAPSKMTTVTSSGGAATTEPEHSDSHEQDLRKKSLKQPSSKSDKPKPFVFDGDDELKSGMIKVAKLLKHALKISASVSTPISLDLADIYCSLNRRSEAEAMFANVNHSSNPVERETANRKLGRFYIKIGDFEKADLKIEEALKIRSQITPEESVLKELEETVQILVDHYTHDNTGRGKFWQDQLIQLNPSLAEDHSKSGQKSSKTRK